ncbi:aminoglycoside phosphotransferase family protein [Limisphaera ngatamarikiensis]|uniref:Aminoglycoside phosphotransferase family protein n=1 Tax=Limisphaera ngatamarikiensis TaxID=1324935 RepID=A0A6M1RRC3_9BACT|nr:phosphotransferase [Limisphaera ngatamarikiensis]NGO40109.1 aminoglycoside phosphotransferase family protein [Limisphaera ngatamarikiensis]
MTEAELPWISVLPPPRPGRPVLKLAGWLVTRGGEPLLWLPAPPRCARATLTLYPAQTRRARWARRILTWAIGRVPAPGARRCELHVDAEAPLVRLLGGASSTGSPPLFGVFCGNPRAAGRRFLFLQFTPEGQPGQVLKVGSDSAAIRRLRAEAEFLLRADCDRLRAPRLLQVWEGNGAMAIVQPWVPGTAPRRVSPRLLGSMLSSWIHRDKRVRLDQLGVWQRLTGHLSESGFSCPWLAALGRAEVHPTVFHGDFAPWNLRYDPGSDRWWVVDWERAQLEGPPGWDWAHYWVQTMVLVERRRPERILRALAAACESAPVRSYFADAGADEVRHGLVVAGLLFQFLEWPPTEGWTAWGEVLQACTERLARHGSLVTA